MSGLKQAWEYSFIHSSATGRGDEEIGPCLTYDKASAFGKGCIKQREVFICPQPEATKPARDLGAAIPGELRPEHLTECAVEKSSKEHYCDGWNACRKAAAALASPADALVEGDRVDAERYRHLRELMQFSTPPNKPTTMKLRAALAARATPAQPASTKTYQQRADDAGLTVRTKEILFDYAIAEITDLRAICKHDAAEQADIAKRLRRVAKAAGVPVDDDDSFVYGVAFALLGQIASALEAKPSPSSVSDAIRAMPLPEADYKFGTKGMLCEDAWTADQVRAILSEAAALAEQVQGQQVPNLQRITDAIVSMREFYLGMLASSLRNDRADAFDKARHKDITKMVQEIIISELAAAPSIAQDGQKSGDA